MNFKTADSNKCTNEINDEKARDNEKDKDNKIDNDKQRQIPLDLKLISAVFWLEKNVFLKKKKNECTC